MHCLILVWNSKSKDLRKIYIIHSIDKKGNGYSKTMERQNQREYLGRKSSFGAQCKHCQYCEGCLRKRWLRYNSRYSNIWDRWFVSGIKISFFGKNKWRASMVVSFGNIDHTWILKGIRNVWLRWLMNFYKWFMYFKWANIRLYNI